MVGKSNKDIRVKLHAYSIEHRVIQVLVNGTLLEYTINGSVAILLKRLQNKVKVHDYIGALQLLREYKRPHTKVKVSFLDVLTSPDQVKNLRVDHNLDS